MRLADFILRDMERILVHWQAFARTREGAKGMSPLALRDHAEEILQAVARDLRTAQTRDEQAEKSKGLAPTDPEAPETAAQTHATLRARSGFDIEEMASEYRALRASVMRLWADACGKEPLHLGDVIRFNEAIDQALAESIAFFTAQVERSRNLLMGMLGHDMRSPLQAIQMTAYYLGALNAGDAVSGASVRLIRSGERMRSLLDDLVDFNRTSLGLGISVDPNPVDIAVLFDDELELQRAALPGRDIELALDGATTGAWDGMRLQQLLGNLVQNAAKYGDDDSPIRVTVDGTGDDLWFRVANRGPTIQMANLELLFNPLQRGPGTDVYTSGSSLGLGLFIAREIATAHGGEIDAASENNETTFSVRLPRAAGGAPPPATHAEKRSSAGS
jgi:signal transduction histidine kinase